MLVRSPITSVEYLALPDEFDQWGNRIRDELIGGQVVKYPIQPLSHDLPRNEVGEALIRYLLANEHLELTVIITTGFLVTKYDTSVPDVSVVENKQLGREDVRITEGPPAIAIEVVAPTDKAVHLRRKIDAYRENGSKTVWVVYPSARSVVVYSGGTIREVKRDQLIDDPLLPGFSAPVSRFFDLTRHWSLDLLFRVTKLPYLLEISAITAVDCNKLTKGVLGNTSRSEVNP